MVNYPKNELIFVFDVLYLCLGNHDKDTN
jgi:hypothetical protein